MLSLSLRRRVGLCVRACGSCCQRSFCGIGGPDFVSAATGRGYRLLAVLAVLRRAVCVFLVEHIQTWYEYDAYANVQSTSQSRARVASSNSASATAQVVFPASYDQAIRQAQLSVQAAIADGATLMEVEFPATTLSSVSGDGEGANEMTASMQYLRQFLGAFRDRAPNVRVFWPDNQEMAVAQRGQSMDPGAGRNQTDPVFPEDGAAKFGMGYLTKQNAVWAALGVNLGLGGAKFTPVDQVKPSDELLVVAYPSFNPREELSAVNELHQRVAGPRGIPIVVFNGELDRIRGGYYPALFFSELAALAKDFIPRFQTAYYIHNFKGTRPGVLFRAYPGPWCVFRRQLTDNEELRLIWTSEERPSLKQVVVEILPSNL